MVPSREAPRVLVVTSNRSVRRRVSRALASAGYVLDHCGAIRTDVEQALVRPPVMCLVDTEGDGAWVRWVLEKLSVEHKDTISLLLSHDSTNELILELLTNHNLNNLIAKHGGVAASSDLIDETELIVTCQKLLLHDIFGIDKYLPTWGIKIHEHNMTDSRDKPGLLSELGSFLDATDCFGPIKYAVELVADELIMNAVFNAPTDAEGKPRYADVDRQQRILLAPEEAITFRYACDGRNIVLSVSDRFGSLNRDVIVKYLSRCFMGKGEVEEKKAGAGLGLYMVFNSITQLTFNIHAGVATEVIALFYVRSGSRAFRSASRSLNLFLLR